MPGMNGAAATEEILRRCPGTKVLALTSFSDEELIENTLRAGAIGYLMKNVSGDQLAEAIRGGQRGQVHAGPRGR